MGRESCGARAEGLGKGPVRNKEGEIRAGRHPPGRVEPSSNTYRMSSLGEASSKFPLHVLVWNNDYRQLDKELEGKVKWAPDQHMVLSFSETTQGRIQDIID